MGEITLAMRQYEPAPRQKKWRPTLRQRLRRRVRVFTWRMRRVFKRLIFLGLICAILYGAFVVHNSEQQLQKLSTPAAFGYSQATTLFETLQSRSQFWESYRLYSVASVILAFSIIFLLYQRKRRQVERVSREVAAMQLALHRSARRCVRCA